MTGVIDRALALCALNGRLVLVTGLAAGLFLPRLAQAMAPHLPWMVAVLLFLSAFRIGPAQTLGQIRLIWRSLAELFVLQLILPIIALGFFWAIGVADTAPAMAVVLMLAAPPITGAPNFVILSGHAPAPAMRLLVLGTAAFPFTALTVFWLLPGIEGGVTAALRLMVTILGAVGVGFAARVMMMPTPDDRQIRALDGLGVVALAIIVIGLMAGIGPVLEEDKWALAGWFAVAFAANFGMQALGFALTRALMEPPRRMAFGIISGNRNVALFLIALPPDAIAMLLPFIGCYQFPMYLTPLVLRAFAVRRERHAP